MTNLADKVQNALDETRMLVLGVEVLIGFGFRSFLEPGFAGLSSHVQLLKLVALALLIVTFALLLLPSAEHQIVYRGQDTSEFHRLATYTAATALFPFALGLSIDLSVAMTAIVGNQIAAFVGAIVLATTLLAWFGPFIFRKKGFPMPRSSRNTPTSVKVRQVLTEARVILPGAQALLGFALIATLMDSFPDLPQLSRTIHALSLLSVALAVIILMMPAAYHRIVERGEETEEFYRIASWMVLLALLPLGLGISGSFYVAAERVFGSPLTAAAGAILLIIGLCAVWFLLPLWKRRSRVRNERAER